MQGEFKDKWGIILGGSSGLGLASALKLAEHGMNLCIIHRDRRSELPQLESQWEKIKSHGVELITLNKDALKPETRAEALDRLSGKPVYLLLHSLAKGHLKPLVGDAEQRLRSEDVTLTAQAMGSSLLDWTNELVAGGYFCNPARIIGFTSEGNSRSWPSYGAVSAAKGVLEALIRQMAIEYAHLGIKANTLQAGITKTASFGMIPNSEKMAQWSEKRNPLGRLTLPEDVANVVYLLCKEEADWINGTNLKVDGDESLR